MIENITVLGGEITHQVITHAVDVMFKKNGESYEANVTIVVTDDMNISCTDVDHYLANEDELPELTVEEKQQLFDMADSHNIS